MAYQVLSRKWRPQLFEEIVGQDHIVRTLKNAISLERIAHAYLFTGMRGTGKTSTARILAKALNCRDGPTISPCNQCDNCQEIIRTESLDVLEIDGASNRGIDEIRELREKARFSPAKARFKIYIIDEVHMLTNPAFNALLKILEEPPPYIIFIFATTDPHKLLPTIISRCQRFDFRKIPTPNILTRLQQIVEKEKISTNKEALTLIAEEAENSMRDGEKILDQTVSYAEGEITEKDVVDILGIVEKRYIFQLTQNILEKNPLANIELINQLLEEGRDPNWLIRGWRKWFRDLVILKMGGNSFLFLSPSEKKEAEKQSSLFTLAQLIHFMDLLSQTRQKLAFSSQPQIDLELLLVELSSDFDIDTSNSKEPELMKIYQKILNLEQRLSLKSSLPETEKKEKPKVKTYLTKEEKEKEPTLEETKAVKQKVEEKESNDNEFFEKWPLIVKEIGKKKKTLGTWLQKATLLKVEKDLATLSLKNGFHQETLTRNSNLYLIEDTIKKFLSYPFHLKYIVEKGKEKDKPKKTSSSSSEWSEFITKAMDIFEGEIVEGKTRR